MCVIAIIQARLSSARLPRKVLADIAGKPMLQRVYERACRIPGVDEVRFAIPNNEPELDAWIKDTLHVLPMLGHPTDVLERFYVSAFPGDPETIIRLTGDDPLLDPALAADVLRAYERGPRGKTYAHNLGPATDGFDVEVFAHALLNKAFHETSARSDREHVTPWMRRGGVGIVVLQVVVDGPSVKLSVDTAEDLARVRGIYARVGTEYFDHATAIAVWRALAPITTER